MLIIPIFQRLVIRDDAESAARGCLMRMHFENGRDDDLWACHAHANASRRMLPSPPCQ